MSLGVYVWCTCNVYIPGEGKGNCSPCVDNTLYCTVLYSKETMGSAVNNPALYIYSIWSTGKCTWPHRQWREGHAHAPEAVHRQGKEDQDGEIWQRETEVRGQRWWDMQAHGSLKWQRGVSKLTSSPRQCQCVYVIIQLTYTGDTAHKHDVWYDVSVRGYVLAGSLDP